MPTLNVRAGNGTTRTLGRVLEGKSKLNTARTCRVQVGKTQSRTVAQMRALPVGAPIPPGAYAWPVIHWISHATITGVMTTGTVRKD